MSTFFTRSSVSVSPAFFIFSAATLGQTKRPEQFAVGFALETTNELAHALDKLHRKNFDLVVLNSLRDAGAGFGHDTNKVSVLDRAGQVLTFELQAKTELARRLVPLIQARFATLYA